MKQFIFLKIILSFLTFLISNEKVWANDPVVKPELFCDGKCAPTVHPAATYNAEQDAEALNKAMKSNGTEEKVLINIISKRGIVQRLEIAESYKTKYGSELVTDLKGETDGKFEDVLVALVTPLPNFYAKEIHDAIEGVGTDEKVFVETLCSMNNAAIKSIVSVYEPLYSKTLEDDVRGDTSGNFQKLMVSLIEGKREEGSTVDNEKAAADAAELLKQGVLAWGTDESLFNNIFTTKSYQYLKQVFVEYKKVAGHDIEDDIKKEFSGTALDGFLSLTKIIKDKPAYLAEQLEETMKGVGTKDQDLIRIVVTRSEIDLADVKVAYEKLYGKTVESAVSSEITGNYLELMLNIIKG